jgi:hypothetical protein
MLQFFYFDCSVLSICTFFVPFFSTTRLNIYLASYYMPPTATSTSKVDPPLGPNGSLPIGYGVGGSPPSRYHLKPNQILDVGYMKLFISTHAVDLSSICQPSPCSGKDPPQASRKLYPLELEDEIPAIWDVITVAVIQRPKGTKEEAAPVLK